MTLPLAALLLLPLSPPPHFAVLGYLPEWRYEGANWETLCRQLSHLIFFSLETNADGSIGATDRLPPQPLLAEARAAAARHGTALLLCFGGNGRSAHFSAMVRDGRARERFVAEAVSLVESVGLDGIDVNWEYPGYRFGTGYLSEAEVAADYEGLHALLGELRAALGPRRPLTMSYYPDTRQERLLAGAADRHVDFCMMMSYDQAGGHHSERGWGNRMVDQALRLGLRPSRVAAGLPFYGRRPSSDWVTYEDIVQRHWPLDPGVDVVSDLSFNGVETIEARTRYAAGKVGGVMVWEVGGDCREVPTVHAHDGTSHARTCPGDGDGASLLAAITRGRGQRELLQYRRPEHTEDL